MSYGTGAVGRPEIAKYSFNNIPYNLHRYLLGGFRMGNYFPFIDGVKEGPIPLPTRTHEGVDQIYGCLIFFPVLLFGALALWKNRRLSTLLLLCGFGNLALLVGLGFGTFRYAVDYLGVMAFLAAIGICHAYDLPSGFGRRVAISLLFFLLVGSGMAGLCQATSVARTHGLFDINRPKDFARLAYPFNRLSYWLESLTKRGPRAIRVKLTLPTDKYGQVEPLLVYGEPGLQDFIYFYYTEPQQIQIGFESIGHGGPLSRPIAIDYNQSHIFDIMAGNFIPPDDHPLLQSIPPGDLSLARQHINIAIDGQTALEDSVYLHPSRSRFLIGQSPDDPAFGKQFTGTITQMKGRLLRNIGLFSGWTRDDFGPVEVQLNLKTAELGIGLPLVSVGNRPFGAILVLDCLSQTSVRFRWIHYNGTTVSSEPINWVYGEPHTLELGVGSLLPPVQSSLWNSDLSLAGREGAKRHLSCSVDNREVWRTEVNAPEAYPSTVKIGENALMLSKIADALNGDILSSKRRPW